MLSLDDKYYQIPGKSEGGWMLQGMRETRWIEQPFHYTMHGFTFRGVKYEGKFTFVYDGNSVRPNARTLRLYGAEMLQPIVSALSTRKHKPKPKTQTKVEPEETENLEVERLLAQCSCGLDVYELMAKLKREGRSTPDVEERLKAAARRMTFGRK